MIANPFQFDSAVSGNQYCRPEKEVSRLAGLMASGQNSILLAHKDWGKTSLMQVAVAEVLAKNPRMRAACFTLEKETSTHRFLAEFTNALFKSVCRKSDDWLQLPTKVFEHLRPEVHINPDTPDDAYISFNWEELEKHVEDVLLLPARLAALTKSRLLVCIDDFHELCFVDDPLPLMRSIRDSRYQERVSFHLASLPLHPMQGWVSAPSGPFFEYGEVLFLHPLYAEHWVSFLTGRFTATQKYLSEEVAARLVRLADNQPLFIQLFAHALWEETERNATRPLLQKAIENLMNQYDTEFRNRMHSFSPGRAQLLKQFIFSQRPADAEQGKDANSKRPPKAMNRLLRDGILFPYKGNLHFRSPLFRRWLIYRYYGGTTE